MCFPDSSGGKESTCNAGDPSSIPGLGRSAGEGIGYPLQYSCASLVAQLVKNLPAMQETWVRSLGWEVPLEKGKATHSSILGWRIPWSMGWQRVGHDSATNTHLAYQLTLKILGLASLHNFMSQFLIINLFLSIYLPIYLCTALSKHTIS